MAKKISVLLLISFLMISSAPQTFGQSSVKIGTQFEIYAGMGYYEPSLKQWDDGLDEFKKILTTSSIVTVSDIGYLKGQSMINIGFKYHFNPSLSLGLSVGHYESDASGTYFLDMTTRQTKYPKYKVHEVDDIELSQKIRMNPTQLTLYFNVPHLPMKDVLNLYVGGGVGYYFSTIKNDLGVDAVVELSEGKKPYNDTTYTTNLLSNVRANLNPLGYHLLTGLNVGYGILHLNVEFGYSFATADIKEDDWQYFSQRQSFFDYLPEDLFDDLEVKKLDYHGYMIRGNLGLAF